MMTSLTLEDRIAKGEAYFKSGYNCAQSVVLSFSDIVKVDGKILENVSAPFGGGIGRMREVCGTISGMVIILGLVRNYDCSDNRQKLTLYAEEQELAERFKTMHGSIICRELLDMASEKHEDPHMNNTHKHSCVQFVRNAIEILGTYFKEKGIDL